MKALICQKNEFTSSRTGETYYQLFLAKRDSKGVVRIVMSPKSNYKNIQPYFVEKAVFDVVEAGKIYDFTMVADGNSEVLRMPKLASGVKPADSL